MKNKKIVLTLALTFAIGIGATAYAAGTSPAPNRNNVCQSQGMGMGYGAGRISNFRGYDILSTLLKNKGVSDEDINAALDSGKSLHDLLNDKGVTDEEIKNFMAEEKSKSIDQAVVDGKITKEQAETMKTNIKENTANCTGDGNGMGRGQRGNGPRMQR